MFSLFDINSCNSQHVHRFLSDFLYIPCINVSAKLRIALPAKAGWIGLEPLRFFTGTVGTLKAKTIYIYIYNQMNLCTYLHFFLQTGRASTETVTTDTFDIAEILSWLY